MNLPKMLHLRKVGLSNIIFRNVTGLRSRAAHTTSDAEVFADDDEESKRVPRFEPVPEEGELDQAGGRRFEALCMFLASNY